MTDDHRSEDPGPDANEPPLLLPVDPAGSERAVLRTSRASRWLAVLRRKRCARVGRRCVSQRSRTGLDSARVQAT